MNKYFLSICIIASCFFIYPFSTKASPSSVKDSISNSNENTSIDIAKKAVKSTESKTSKAKESEEELGGPGRQEAEIEYVNDIDEMNENTRREIEEKRKIKQEQQGKKKTNYKNRSGFLEKEKTEQNDMDYSDFSDDTSLDSSSDMDANQESTDKDSLITDDIPDYNVEGNNDDFSLPDEKDSNMNNDMDMKMEMEPGVDEKDDFTDYDKKYTDEFEKERSSSGVDFLDDSFYETPEPSSNDPLDTNEYDSSFGTGF